LLTSSEGGVDQLSKAKRLPIETSAAKWTPKVAPSRL